MNVTRVGGAHRSMSLQCLVVVCEDDTLLESKLVRLAWSVPDTHYSASRMEDRALNLSWDRRSMLPSVLLGSFFYILTIFVRLKAGLITITTRTWESMAIEQAKVKLRRQATQACRKIVDEIVYIHAQYPLSTEH